MVISSDEFVEVHHAQRHAFSVLVFAQALLAHEELPLEVVPSHSAHVLRTPQLLLLHFARLHSHLEPPFLRPQVQNLYRLYIRLQFLLLGQQAHKQDLFELRHFAHFSLLAAFFLFEVLQAIVRGHMIRKRNAILHHSL